MIKNLVWIFVAVFIFTSFSSSVFALGNPSVWYCMKAGYEWERITNPDGSQDCICIFPDGTNCTTWDYYCKCEIEGVGCSPYVNYSCHYPCHEVPCGEPGEKVVAIECCEGLKRILPPCVFDEECNQMRLPAYYFCTDCGNGICEEWESKCTCPEDCKEKECVPLGGGGPNPSLGPNDPNKDKKCCDDLTLTLPKRAFRISASGECTPGTGFGFLCLSCGDGVCDYEYENYCNCPEDCKKGGTVEEEIVQPIAGEIEPIAGEIEKMREEEVKKTIEISPTEAREVITRKWCPEGCTCTEESIEYPVISGTIAEEISCPVGCICTANTIKCPVTEENLIESVKEKIETVDEAKEVVIEKTTQNELSIKSENVVATTKEKLVIEDNKLFLESAKVGKQIKILPNVASEAAIESVIQTVKKIELKEEAAKPVYSVKGTKQARILFIFPVTLEIETKVSAENGEIISVKKPWWSFLAW